MMKVGLPKINIVFFAFALMLVGCDADKNSSTSSTAVVDDVAKSTAHSHEHAHQHDDEHGHDHHHHDGHSHHGHNHNHDHSDESSKIHAGYFSDAAIKDRALSDWSGDWQSVYPYLLDGALDGVLRAKAALSDDKTFADYQAYYAKGYKTEVERIVIDDYSVTFYQNGQLNRGEYVYDGYEILNYKKGNRGVRFLFTLKGENPQLPKYIQFSDHNIAPTKAFHFHLYWGNDSQQMLFNELENWPTYYPSELTADEIIDEMLAH